MVTYLVTASYLQTDWMVILIYNILHKLAPQSRYLRVRTLDTEYEVKQYVIYYNNGGLDLHRSGGAILLPESEDKALT